MRLFGGELSSDGVPHVLVLPSLDTQYAARAIEELARTLAAWGLPSSGTLARTALAIQRLVASHPGQTAVATEACCDVTMFDSREVGVVVQQPVIETPRPRRDVAVLPPSTPRRLRRS